jgi:hypothetical protein
VAAARGSAVAMYRLGMLYAEDRLMPRDETLAISWYARADETRRADEASHPPPVDARDIRTLTRDARSGDREAAFLLARRYQTGDGVKADLSDARDWYLEAIGGLEKHPHYYKNLFMYREPKEGSPEALNGLLQPGPQHRVGQHPLKVPAAHAHPLQARRQCREPTKDVCPQRLAVHVAGSGFRAQQVGGAHLHAGGAQRHGRHEATPVGDAAGGHHRNVHGLRHQRGQHHGGDFIGALDAAVEFSVGHTREREQFGRPLSAFQAVQHTLAGMAGEVERARAATDLAVTAAADFGFDSPQTDYAVTVAKVTLGQVVPHVVTAAHQLHGAIGATFEHRLWLATMRARSWVEEFGDTAHYAQRLGRLVLAAADPWDVMIGAQTSPV